MALIAATLGSAAAAAHAESDSPLYVVSYYEVISASQGAADNATPEELFSNYRQSLAKEKGAVSVELLRDRGRHSHYTLIEVWRDQAAYKTHTTSASAKQFASAVQPWLAGPKDERAYTKFQ